MGKIMGSWRGEIVYMFRKGYLVMVVVWLVVGGGLGWWIGEEWVERLWEKRGMGGWVFVRWLVVVSVIRVVRVRLEWWKNGNEKGVGSMKRE